MRQLRMTITSISVKENSPDLNPVDYRIWGLMQQVRDQVFDKKKSKACRQHVTNPPFAFQIAFPRGTDFTGFLQEGQKATHAACKPLFLAVAEI